MKTVEVNNVVWREGHQFIARCLNVDISSCGDSKEEALENLEEALVLFLEGNEQVKLERMELPELVSSKLKLA